MQKISQKCHYVYKYFINMNIPKYIIKKHIKINNEVTLLINNKES